MKRRLAFVLFGFLLGGNAALVNLAQAADKQVETTMRAGKISAEAEERAMSQCSTSRMVVSIPDWDYRTSTERTIDRIVTFDWDGGCLEGKRDGEGMLTWTTDTDYGDRRDVVQTRAEGRFVKGQRVGLWCETMKLPTAEVSGCHVLASHSKPLTSVYRKQPDGSWKEGILEVTTGVTLAAGALEAQSAKVLADATGGKKDLKVDVLGKSQILDDLMRGSRIALAKAPTFEPIPLKDKRIGVVLSSNTISELERFTRGREELIAASRQLTGNATQYRAQFIAASNPDRLLANVVKTVRNVAKSVEAADDLTGLKQGKYDYVLIVDWKDMTRFDLLGKFGSFPTLNGRPDPAKLDPSAVACESIGGFLVSPDMKAVKQKYPILFCDYKTGIRLGESDDEHYMLLLNAFFERNWGKGPHNLGLLMSDFDFFLTH